MSNPKITYEEMQVTCRWLTTAQRFLAFSRGHAENCKRRACKSAGMCHAESVSQPIEGIVCGLPQKEGDIEQTVQLALFGMMLEEGLLQNSDEPVTNSRHN